MSDQYLNWIDGDWAQGGGGTIDVENPATGAGFATQALADAKDVDHAVAAARRVFESGVLGNMRPVERGRMVREMGDHLLENHEELARLLTREQGKPLWESRGEITNAARYFEYFGNQAETLEGKQIPLGAGYVDFTLLEPYGVSGQIIPWNFPMEIAARSIACAITTGNTVVLKSSELTPLTSHIFGLAAKTAGLPDGAVNILSGYGHDAGAALAAHPGVDQLVFTGSGATGSKIATAAAAHIAPCVLELGGKSAAIVFEDADLDAFISSLRRGIFTNSGQVCSAMSRVLVQKSLYDDLVERAKTLAQGIEVKPGLDGEEAFASMGPMISQTQLDRALGLIGAAKGTDGRLAQGGNRMDREGFFLNPTVFDEVDPASQIAQTEIFGPVVCITAFETQAEAIALANGTDYGLVAGIFTADINRALTTAKKLRAGQVFVNEWFAGGVETPFGGYGKSGYGREKGREALWNYMQTKNIAIKLDSIDG